MATGGMTHALHFATHRPEPIRQASLLMVLAAGVSCGDGVVSMLRTYARESKGVWNAKVSQLAMLLEQGRTLADSVSVVDDLLPEESVIAIRIAEQSGNVEAVLADEAVRLSRLSQQQRSSSAPATVVLAVLTLGIATFIVLYLMTFIVPKYKQIFEGFSMDLPRLSRSLFDGSGEIAQLVLLIGLPVVAICVYGVIISWQANGSVLRSGTSKLSDWRPRWRTPMILRMLSLAAIARQPLDEALHSMLRVMQPGWTSNRLSHVRQAVSSGTKWSEAMRSAGFLNRRETHFLDSATRTHHEDWAMRHLATSLERRHRNRVERLRSMIWPAVILLTGLIVGYIVLVFYMPLIQLMNQLIGNSETSSRFS